MKISEVHMVGIHNAVNKKYTLNSDLTYFCGLNGAGKSTVLQSIQLAILGYIPGYPKQNKEIIKHAGNRNSMSVKVTFDDGSSIQRSYTTKGGTVSETVVRNPDDLDLTEFIKDTELPIFNFSQFLNLSANDQKKWFLDFLPSRSKYEGWETELRDMCESDPLFDENYFDERVREFKQILDANPKAIDGFKEVNSKVKEYISFERGNASSLQSTLNNMLRYSDEDIQNVSSDLIKSQIDDLRKQRDIISSESSNLNEVERIKSKFDSISKEFPGTLEENSTYQDCNKALEDSKEEQLQLTEQGKIYEDQMKSFNEEAKNIHNQMNDINDKIDALNREKRTIVTDDFHGVCPYTKEHCESIQHFESDNKSKVSEIDSKIESLENELSELNVDFKNIKNNYTSVEDKYKSIPSQIKSLKLNDDVNRRSVVELASNYEMKTKLQKDYEEILKTTSSENLSHEEYENKMKEITEKLDKLQDNLVKVQSNERYDAMFDKVSSDMVISKKNLDILNIMEKYTGANGVQNNIALQPFVNLQDSLTKYLKMMFESDDVRCWINLENKSNSFDFGMQRGNCTIGFDTLSGGEKCMYMMALLTCISQRSSSDFKVVFVDDLIDNMDGKHRLALSNFCEKIDDVQYIFAGINKFRSTDTLVGGYQ